MSDASLAARSVERTQTLRSWTRPVEVRPQAGAQNHARMQAVSLKTLRAQLLGQRKGKQIVCCLGLSVRRVSVIKLPILQGNSRVSHNGC